MSPAASMTCASAADRPGPTCAIVSPSTRTSARGSSPSESSCVRTIASLMRIRSAMGPLLRRAVAACVGGRPPILGRRRVSLVSRARVDRPRVPRAHLPSLSFAAGCSASQRSRRATATVEKSRPPVRRSAACRTSARFAADCGIGTPLEAAKPRMSRRSFSASASANAGGVESRREERLALVADVRSADRARGQDVVGRLQVDTGRFGEDERLRERAVEPEDDRVDGELHRRPRSERAEMEDRLRERLEGRPGTLEVVRLAADHQRELAALGETDAAADRCVEEASALLRARRPRTSGSCRGGPCSSRRGRSAAARPR